MGNRAVITTKGGDRKNKLGVYLHWNGGRDSVEAFLKYCDMRGFRYPENDNYGWARLTQVIANFFGGDLSIGIDICDRLDCDNWDNGVYLIEKWKIVGREDFENGVEQDEYDLLSMVIDIDQHQPKGDQIGEEEIRKKFEKGE